MYSTREKKQMRENKRKTLHLCDLFSTYCPADLLCGGIDVYLYLYRATVTIESSVADIGRFAGLGFISSDIEGSGSYSFVFFYFFPLWKRKRRPITNGSTPLCREYKQCFLLICAGRLSVFRRRPSVL